MIAIPGKNVLLLTNIRKTNTYTCVAASKLGIIETKTNVKVQCKLQMFMVMLTMVYGHDNDCGHDHHGQMD